MLQILLSNTNTTGRYRESKSGKTGYLSGVLNLPVNNDGNWEKRAQFVDLSFSGDQLEKLRNMTKNMDTENKYKLCLDIAAKDIIVKPYNDTLNIELVVVDFGFAPRGENNEHVMSISRGRLTRDLVENNGVWYTTIATDAPQQGESRFFELKLTGAAAQQAQKLKLKKGYSVCIKNAEWTARLNDKGYTETRLSISAADSIAYASAYKAKKDDEGNNGSNETPVPPAQEASPAAAPETQAPVPPADIPDAFAGAMPDDFMSVAGFEGEEEQF